METNGPSRAPNSNLVAIGAGQGRSGAEASEPVPKAGAVVSVRVLENLGGGLYRVAVGSRSLFARSAQTLAVGSLFSARVQRSDGTLMFQPLGAQRAATADRGLPHPARDAATSGLLGRGSIPGDPARSAALAALLAEGASPSAAGAIERLRRAFGRALRGSAAKDENERATLAARMEAKGIPAEDAAIDAIVAASEGFSGRGGEDGSGRDADHAGHRGGTDPRENGGMSGDAAPAAVADTMAMGTVSVDAARELEIAIQEAELPAILASLVKGIVLRSGGEGTLLNLFNHVPGPDGSWIYAPFGFELDSIAFSGIIRLRLPRISGGPGRIEADFATRGERGERRWSFGLDFGTATSLKLRCDEAVALSTLRRRLPELRADFAEAGLAVDASVAGEGKSIPGDVDVEA